LNGGDAALKEVAMTGQAHWLPFAILIAAALPLLYLWIRDRREQRKYKVEQTHVRCRARNNQLVDSTVIRDAKTGEPIGIQTCSAQPEGVHCDRACLPLLVHSPEAQSVASSSKNQIDR
jgi:hypothetical protein